MVAGIFFFFSALLLGFLGRKQRFGFWGYFFATFLLTPLVALLLLIASNGGTRETN